MSSTITATKQVLLLRRPWLWLWLWLLPLACASYSLFFFLLVRPIQPHLHEPLCLSRTHLPLKPFFPHIAPALHLEWELYVDMHRRCTTNLTAHALTKPPHPEESQFSCKFLVYIDGVEGLGNRFLSLASAWVYSMLTHRVLLIDTRRDMPKLLCEPFPGSSWLLPDDFSYDSASSWPSLGSILSSSKSPPNNDTVSLESYGPALQIYLRHDQGYGDCQLFCDHIQDALAQVRSLSWISNLYLLPHLHLVPSFWRKMASLFPSPQNTFALVSRLLLCPSNEVWRLVLDDYSSHLSRAKTKVGVQIRLVRIGGSPAAFTDAALHGILQCLIKNSFLPNTTSDAYGDDGEQSHDGLASRNRNTTVDVGLQVVSLQRRYAERIASLYSQSGDDGGERVRVHTLCSLENQDMSFEQAKLAYAEMILLSLTDKLATSASSTFGYIAQSWGNLPSLILDFGELNNGRGATNICRKPAQSIDPCTHDPLVPPCLQLIASEDRQPHPMIINSSYLSSDHRKWLTDHLHFCQDRPGAWQLVDARDTHLYPAVFLYHETG